MFEIVRQDLQRCVRVNQMGAGNLAAYLREMFNPGTQAIMIHRFGVWSDGMRFPPLRYFLRVVHFVIQNVVAWRVGIYIPVKADIAPGMAIHTWGGGVFLPSCKIGRNLTFVGGGELCDYDTLEIGDEVTVGAGTKSTGRIRIGNRVTTGPNSVIIEDVPDDCLVFGNPGRVVRKLSASRKLAKVGTGPTPGSVSSQSLATL
jgi:serine O-acetyltransferase